MIYYRAIFVLIILIVSVIITMKSMKDGIYATSFTKSPHQPPNYVFSIVWTTIYVTYAIGWEYLIRNGMPSWLNTLYVINMLLNLGWTVAYFYYGNELLAKYIIIVLLLLTLFQSYAVWNYVPATKYTSLSSLSLLVYASWLTIASGLLWESKFTV